MIFIKALLLFTLSYSIEAEDLYFESDKKAIRHCKKHRTAMALKMLRLVDENGKCPKRNGNCIESKLVWAPVYLPMGQRERASTRNFKLITQNGRADQLDCNLSKNNTLFHLEFIHDVARDFIPSRYFSHNKIHVHVEPEYSYTYMGGISDETTFNMALTTHGYVSMTSGLFEEQNEIWFYKNKKDQKKHASLMFACHFDGYKNSSFCLNSPSIRASRVPTIIYHEYFHTLVDPFIGKDGFSHPLKEAMATTLSLFLVPFEKEYMTSNSMDAPSKTLRLKDSERKWTNVSLSAVKDEEVSLSGHVIANSQHVLELSYAFLDLLKKLDRRFSKRSVMRVFFSLLENISTVEKLKLRDTKKPLIQSCHKSFRSNYKSDRCIEIIEDWISKIK